jgi:hypothetical protein
MHQNFPNYKMNHFTSVPNIKLQTNISNWRQHLEEELYSSRHHDLKYLHITDLDLYIPFLLVQESAVKFKVNLWCIHDISKSSFKLHLFSIKYPKVILYYMKFNVSEHYFKECHLLSYYNQKQLLIITIKKV